MIAAALDMARRTGNPVPLTPDMALDRAYRVQANAFADRRQPIAGWKIGLTGEGIRIALGADAPAAGRLAQADILRSPAVALIGPGDYYVEAELLFSMSRALPPQDAPFTPDQVAAAVGALHAGIELVTSRFESDDLPLGLLVADNCMADRLLVGDKVADGWDDRFANMAVTLDGPGNQSARGSTAAVMGSPLLAVTWLANWLAGQGLLLDAGQIVSSGTCTGVTLVMPGDRVVVDMGGLGGAAMEFTAGS
ncbi:fumarylacetoacetate hydrolase family protein [Sphingobium sp. HBC34]|uniref:Fumarylacetoacetate hydrolase family protein n=1 Tax=Sphingobium cyanobacteriorum TaxID=3063954 RepID=A0ABT8ZN24_9SPHN|nr:fumarylacetoacetate hydrolase family protein [Sphingobium sp. HBC34]MDO7835523.1 fumarylacetoacetate hydrolase family protein [Sphingobium sp. HBC34]